MIDLKKFTKTTDAVVPIVNNSFQYSRKKYKVAICQDDWYHVKLTGNTAIIDTNCVVELYDDFITSKKYIIKGYTYNNNIIFQNFDVGQRKLGANVFAPLLLNMLPTFSSIEAIIWEDKNIYYYKPNYTDMLIYRLKQACTDSLNIESFKGMTPELKILYLFHSLEKERIKEEQERIKRRHDKEKFLKTLPGRLALTFARVGATITNYSLAGDRVTVDWQFDDGSGKFNSVLDSDTFRVIEAGFCLSGDDKRHSATSMIELAKSYNEENVLHITRY
jgi:hypothetical protein